MKKKNSLAFIEEGRISEENMKTLTGGGRIDCDIFINDCVELYHFCGTYSDCTWLSKNTCELKYWVNQN